MKNLFARVTVVQTSFKIIHFWTHHVQGYQTLNKLELFWLHSRKISTCQSDKNTEKKKILHCQFDSFSYHLQNTAHSRVEVAYLLSPYSKCCTVLLLLQSWDKILIHFTYLTFNLTSLRSQCNTLVGLQIHCFFCKHFILNQHEHFQHICLLWLQNLEWGETKWSGKILSKKSVLLGSPQVSQVKF